jgi:DHA1 family multidrug resistance protein-like MFS transporter
VLVYSFGAFAIAASAAPGLAPVIAAFAIEATGGWRIAFWEMFGISALALVFLLFALPETNSETILYRRARRLRELTGNPNIYAKTELEHQHRKPSAVLRETLLRPLVLTFTEPIIAALNLYVGLIYATIYSFFESFFLVFGPGGYNFSLGVSTLPFITLTIGAPLSFIGYGLHNKWRFAPLYRKTGGRVKPEERLFMAIPGCFMLPVSILWFAWASNRSHWINPCFAITFFGIACDWVFMPALLYLPDAYPRYAASALASNDFVRSVMGAAMPIASVPLFHNLGVDWGNTIIGLVSVLFIPLP